MRQESSSSRLKESLSAYTVLVYVEPKVSEKNAAKIYKAKRVSSLMISFSSCILAAEGCAYYCFYIRNGKTQIVFFFANWASMLSADRPTVQTTARADLANRRSKTAAAVTFGQLNLATAL